MTSQSDEFEFNRFYRLLRTKYEKKYIEALSNCYTVCVPQSGSITNVEINQKFIDMHILKPSPFFKDQFATMNKRETAYLKIEDNVIVTLEGFSEKATIRILAEEVGYNSSYKPFKTLLIERPFITECLQNKLPYLDQQAISELRELEPTYTKCVDYLLSLPGCSESFRNLEATTSAVKNNYMIVKGYLHEVSTKLECIWSKFVKMFCACVKQPQFLESRVKSNVEHAVESYIMGNIHEKLFPVIREEHEDDDDALNEKCKTIKHLPLEQMGLHKQFCCSQLKAIKEVKVLSQCRTPLEMSLGIKNTLDIITATVHIHLLNADENTEELPCLTADDYIPLFLYVLVQSGLPHLASIAYYLEHFSWSRNEANDMSYSCIMFNAVVKHLSSLNIKYILDNYKEMLNQQEVRQSMKKDHVYNTDGDCLPAAMSSERELERLTKKVEQSTKELVIANEKSLPSKLKAVPFTTSIGSQRSKSNTLQSASLGDFLGSLQEDPFLCYGKQS